MSEDRNDKGFRKLIVWQRAHQLALLIYTLTEKFPKSEIYGLTSQVRRASVSVAANIAEGYGYGRKGQTGRFLDIAQGSLSEVEYFLILSLYFHSISNIFPRKNTIKLKPYAPRVVSCSIVCNKASKNPNPFAPLYLCIICSFALPATPSTSDVPHTPHDTSPAISPPFGT